MPKSVTRTPGSIVRPANRSITAQPNPSSPRKIFPIPATRTRGESIKHPPFHLAPFHLAPFHLAPFHLALFWLAITARLLPRGKRTDGPVGVTCPDLYRDPHLQ